MALWTFCAFPTLAGNRIIDAWVADLDAESHNNFAATLETLEVLPVQFWKRPPFDHVHGKKYQGLSEIRWDGKNKTYRMFGYFGPMRSCYTMLLGCEKKRDLKAEMDLAIKRMRVAKQRTEL